VKKEQNGRESLRKPKSIVGCNASKRRRLSGIIPSFNALQRTRFMKRYNTVSVVLVSEISNTIRQLFSSHGLVNTLTT